MLFSFKPQHESATQNISSLHSHWLILILSTPCVIQSLINYYCINHIPISGCFALQCLFSKQFTVSSWYTCLLISQLISRVLSSVEKVSPWDFPSNPGVKTLHFQCKGHSFNPWSGNLDSTYHPSPTPLPFGKYLPVFYVCESVCFVGEFICVIF